MREGLGGYAVLASNVSDKLLAGAEIPVLVQGVTLKTGQGVLVRGSVIGIETATGKGILCDTDAADGSKVARFILAEDSIDTTAADVVATCYKTGKFNRTALAFGVNGAPNALDADLRAVGIHLTDEKSY
jgi:hypothetical protein